MEEASSSSPVFYHEVVRITRTYLGPAAERFIDRQVTNHLHKKPEALLPADLDKLIDWIRVAMSLITEDSLVLAKYTAQLQELIATSEATLKERHGSQR